MDRQTQADTRTSRPSEGPAIGAFVKTYRTSAGATTAQVSASSGVPVSQIEEIEAGTRVAPWPVVEDLLDASARHLMRDKGLAS